MPSLCFGESDCGDFGLGCGPDGPAAAAAAAVVGGGWGFDPESGDSNPWLLTTLGLDWVKLKLWSRDGHTSDR